MLNVMPETRRKIRKESSYSDIKKKQMLREQQQRLQEIRNRDRQNRIIRDERIRDRFERNRGISKAQEFKNRYGK